MSRAYYYWRGKVQAASSLLRGFSAQGSETTLQDAPCLECCLIGNLRRRS